MNEAQTEAIAQADAELSNAALPTYSELVEALHKVEAEKGHTLHRPAGSRPYPAAVLPQAVTDSVAAILSRIPA